MHGFNTTQYDSYRAEQNIARVVRAIAKTHPEVFLEELTVEEKTSRRGISLHVLEHDDEDRENPVALVPRDTLLAWCRKNERHYQMAADVAPIFRRPDEKAALEWTELALQLLDSAPDRIEIVNRFIGRFQPRGGWSGSLASILEERVKLLAQFRDHADFKFSQHVRAEEIRLQKLIEDTRRWETQQDKSQDERFE